MICNKIKLQDLHNNMIPIEGGKLSTLSFCTAIFSNFHFSFLDRKLNESL